MPLLNTNPYYDDFRPEQNFQQILFVPEMAVQARELTQIQSILKNQIATFANHIFQHGSVVIPGNSRSELNVPYIKVNSTYSGSTVNTNYFQGQTIVGSVSGVRAVVNIIEPATTTEPLTFYLSYVRGGEVDGTPNGKVVFDAGEDVYTLGNASILCNIQSGAGAVGEGSIAYVNAGAYYINGGFVVTPKQYAVMSRYDSTPSCRVVFKIHEDIITSTEDESLLDPSQGSSNYAAPGADRLKVWLEWMTIPLTTELTADYVEIMRYDAGTLLAHSLYPKYSELDKSLARRTFDESGNYVVEGLELQAIESKKIGGVGLSVTGNADKFHYLLSAGKAYLNGFGITNLASQRIEVDKARTESHVLKTSGVKKVQWGQYLFVTAPTGTLNIQTKETIQLWDISATTGGTQLGTAKVYGLDFYAGSGVNTIYKLYVSDLNLTSGSYDSIGSVRGTSFFAKTTIQYFAPVSVGAYAPGNIITSGTRTATVAFFDAGEGMVYAHRHSTAVMPKKGDLITASGASSVIQTVSIVVSSQFRGLVFPLPTTATKSLKTATNTFDLTYTSWVALTIAGGATTSSTVVGTIVPIEAGTFVAVTTSGPDSNSNYTINGTGNAIVRTSAAPAGGVTLYLQVTKQNASPRTKTDTSYTGSYSAAKTVALTHADVYKITSIINNGVDITSRYTLNDGQTDYGYNISSLILKNGLTIPSGTLTVTYSYYVHTAGDFFTVDSYPVGAAIPTYRSPNDGVAYSLRDCVDFRPTVGSSNNTVVPDTFISTSIQKYVPRIDSVCIDANGTIVVLSGTPAAIPVAPTVPSSLYLLNHVTVPAYTYSLLDLGVKRRAVSRYTMSDVNNINERVKKIEDYSLLSNVESALMNTTFIDASTGIDRFHTGYLVETMNDPFMIADAANPAFAATLGGTISCLTEADVVQLTAWSGSVSDIAYTTTNTIVPITTDYVRVNGVMSIKYQDVVFASVTESSRILNVNPFNVVAWKGDMSIVPSRDIWVDVVDLPTIFSESNVTVTNTVINWIAAPVAVTPDPVVATPPVAVPPVAEPVVVQPAPVVSVPVVAPVPEPNTDFGTGDGGSVGADGGNGNGPGGNNGQGSVGDGFGGGDGGGDGGDCFIGSTLVLMADGTQLPISEIKIGDLVMSANGKNINTVLYIESVINDKVLYSPTPDISPFATINHPLSIRDSELLLPHQSKGLYPWLNITNYFEQIYTQPPSGETVFNLWLDGDHTYKVFMFGTHSIVGTGALARALVERDYLTHDECMFVVRESTKGYYSHIGAYVLNNALETMPVIGNIFAQSVLRGGISRKLAIGAMSAIGYIRSFNFKIG